VTLDAWDGTATPRTSDQARDLPFHQRPFRGSGGVARGDVDAFRASPCRTSISSAPIRASRLTSAAPRQDDPCNQQQEEAARRSESAAGDRPCDRRKAIIDGAMNGLGTPIGSHLTPNDPATSISRQYPHDPAKAKALLKEAA